MKRIIILGSTGSIGTQALDIIRSHPSEFQVIGLSARHNSELFQKQIKEFAPKYVVQTSLNENPSEALTSLAQVAEADFVVNALAGKIGLMPTYAAIKAGKKIALANKESLVMAGELLMKLAGETGAQIIPVDSELSSVWQLLQGRPKGVQKIILTASGGPFWGCSREQLAQVSVAEALKHPTWKMGEKVSIDSATLMNKAFEIIEAHVLFGLPVEKIEAVIHRQSIVHALVEFSDGALHASLSKPDMRLPISAALFYPHRTEQQIASLDFSSLHLSFEKIEDSFFEGPRLAYEVIQVGGIMPAALALADELAVEKFLKGQLAFLEIYDFIKRSLEKVKNTPFSFEAVADISRILERV